MRLSDQGRRRDVGGARLLVAGTALAWALACAGQVAGDGSESHFGKCRMDADCADSSTQNRCVSGHCAPPDATSAEVGNITLPLSCAVTTSQVGPYAVTFRFVNSGTTTLYLGPDNVCGSGYAISSCADGYTVPLQPKDTYCGNRCPDPLSACDRPCGSDADVPVAAGATVTRGWNGQAIEFRSKGTAAACGEDINAPAAHYRIAVPVYSTPAPASPGDRPYRTVTADFTLPASGVVDVHIDAQPPIGGPLVDSGPPKDACTPVLARRFSPTDNCFEPAEAIPGVCLNNGGIRDGFLSKVQEIACVVAPDGAYYAVAKSLSACVEGDGWTTSPHGRGNGWTVIGGALALCDQPYVFPDGGRNTSNPECDAVFGVHNWGQRSDGYGQTLAIAGVDGGTGRNCDVHVPQFEGGVPPAP